MPSVVWHIIARAVVDHTHVQFTMKTSPGAKLMSSVVSRRMRNVSLCPLRQGGITMQIGQWNLSQGELSSPDRMFHPTDCVILLMQDLKTAAKRFSLCKDGVKMSTW